MAFILLIFCSAKIYPRSHEEIIEATSCLESVFLDVPQSQSNLDGKSDFTMSFNFMESYNKVKEALNQSAVNSTFSYLASTRTVIYSALGSKITFQIGDIITTQIDEIITYSAPILYRGEALGVVSWNYASAHIVTDEMRISLGNTRL